MGYQDVAEVVEVVEAVEAVVLVAGLGPVALELVLEKDELSESTLALRIHQIKVKLTPTIAGSSGIVEVGAAGGCST